MYGIDFVLTNKLQKTFFALFEFVRYDVKDVAVQGNNSFYTAEMELKLKNGSTMLSEQVVATQWKDGKIYRERYYHA